MTVLTQKQVAVLVAFFESFDLRITGAWSQIEEGMREDFGVDDPEAELEEVRNELLGNS